MELGACFDDDFFEKPPEKKENVPLKYEAKSCSTKWFMDPECVEEGSVDRLNNLRYQADFHYHSKYYKEASKLYERCLEMIPSNNSAARRECYENLARSSLHEGQTTKALEWALRMHAICCNADQSLVSLNLLAIVCHKLGKYPEEMESLEPCLEAHRHYPEIWLRIAYCHAGLLGIWLPYSGIHVPVLTDTNPQCCSFKERTLNASLTQVEVREVNDPGPQEPAQDSRPQEPNDVLSISEAVAASTSDSRSSKCETCDLVTQIIIACLIRARLLMNTPCPNQSAIGIGKKEVLEKKIEAGFKVLEVAQDFLEEATKLLQNDLLEAENGEALSLDEIKSNETEDDIKTQNMAIECGVQNLEHGS